MTAYSSKLCQRIVVRYGVKTDSLRLELELTAHLKSVCTVTGYYEIVEILLKAGATHTIRNHRHLTALHTYVRAAAPT